MFVAKLVTRNDDTGEKENILKTFNTLDELKEFLIQQNELLSDDYIDSFSNFCPVQLHVQKGYARYMITTIRPYTTTRLVWILQDNTIVYNIDEFCAEAIKKMFEEILNACKLSYGEVK